jgi:hypothetical protein
MVAQALQNRANRLFIPVANNISSRENAILRGHALRTELSCLDYPRIHVATI